MSQEQAAAAPACMVCARAREACSWRSMCLLTLVACPGRPCTGLLLRPALEAHVTTARRACQDMHSVGVGGWACQTWRVDRWSAAQLLPPDALCVRRLGRQGCCCAGQQPGSSINLSQPTCQAAVLTWRLVDAATCTLAHPATQACDRLPRCACCCLRATTGPCRRPACWLAATCWWLVCPAVKAGISCCCGCSPTCLLQVDARRALGCGGLVPSTSLQGGLSRCAALPCLKGDVCGACTPCITQRE